MNKQKASPMGEATLWRLYRRLLRERLFARRLPPSFSLTRTPVGDAGIAAALLENLLPGDTLGLAPGDLATRYLCGVPLRELHEAALARLARRSRDGGWALAADAQHGLLPAAGEEQAALAVGAALAARLHQSGSLTVLMDKSAPPQPKRTAPVEPLQSWARAAEAAVSLQLPLLFITGSPEPALAGSKKAPPPLPAIPVDRMDTLALYRVIYESAARARAGGGPTWIACHPWSLAGDSEQDSTASALEAMEKALRARKLFDPRQQRHLQRAIEKEFAAAGW